MKTDHINNARPVGGNYFILYHSNSTGEKRNKTLQEHLETLNPNDYWIIKSTGNQRLVTYEDMLEFKYSGYIFFKKDLYEVDNILGWCEYMKPLHYLSKIPPPFNPNKIIIKQ